MFVEYWKKNQKWCMENSIIWRPRSTKQIEFDSRQLHTVMCCLPFTLVLVCIIISVVKVLSVKLYYHFWIITDVIFFSHLLTTMTCLILKCTPSNSYRQHYLISINHISKIAFSWSILYCYELQFMQKLSNDPSFKVSLDLYSLLYPVKWQIGYI